MLGTLNGVVFLPVFLSLAGPGAAVSRNNYSKVIIIIHNRVVLNVNVTGDKRGKTFNPAAYSARKCLTAERGKKV